MIYTILGILTAWNVGLTVWAILHIRKSVTTWKRFEVIENEIQRLEWSIVGVINELEEAE